MLLQSCMCQSLNCMRGYVEVATQDILVGHGQEPYHSTYGNGASMIDQRQSRKTQEW